MGFVTLFAVALIPALALLFSPRAWLISLGMFAAVVFGLCMLWTVSFSNSCQSDGCIGEVFLAALAAWVGLTSAIAGGVRWAVIVNSRQESSEEK